MMPQKTRYFIGLSIFLFALALTAIVFWLMLLRGPALTQ
jgi:hypothetical protein